MEKLHPIPRRKDISYAC